MVHDTTDKNASRPRFGSIDAAAERLGCSPRTVRRMIAAGELAGYRLGKRMLRVNLDEVEALLRRIPTASAAS